MNDKCQETSVTPDDINAMLDEHWPGAGVRCVEVGPQHALARLTPHPASIRPGGFLSGPILFAAADSAFWFLVAGVQGRPEPMALTSELSIRFLRPAVGSTIYARAELERAGRSSVVATVTVWVEDQRSRPCAVAQGTYSLPPEPPT